MNFACARHEKIPAYRCRLLPVKYIICVGAEDWGWHLGVGAKKGLWERGSWFSAWDWCGGKFASFCKRIPSKQGNYFFAFNPYTYVDYSFFLCRLKINHVTEIQNMHLFDTVSECRISECRISKCRISECRICENRISECRISECRKSANAESANAESLRTPNQRTSKISETVLSCIIVSSVVQSSVVRSWVVRSWVVWSWVVLSWIVQSSVVRSWVVRSWVIRSSVILG
jgi:hypothetical protein